MSNPSVTASITVDDKASPRLRELVELSQKLNRVAKDALNERGGNAYANSLRQATSAAREHINAMERLHRVQSAVASSFAGIAGAKAFHAAAHAVKDYIPYERDVRYQRAIQGYSTSEMELLERQRVNAATVYGLKPEDTLHAQQAFVTRAFNAQITEAGTQQAIILSKALNVNAEQAAKIVEGLTFGQGIHLHNAADARREIAKSTDIAALAAKSGSMTPEDISQFAKYGIGMSTAAGISPQQAFAVGMTLRRANVAGDESGVFMRQMSARLLAPTKQAFEAFAHMGIDYNKYATQGSVSPEAIDASLRRRYGKGLSDEGKASLGKAFNDESRNALGNRENFASAVREAIEASGEKLTRTDEKHLVEGALRQYDLAKGGLKGGDLFNDILAKASPKDLQALVGDRQGGRAVMLLNALEQYREYLEKLSHADGYATKIADERMQGLAAAVDRLSSSMDMASKQMVKANESWLTPLASSAARAAAAFTALPDRTKEALSVAGAVTSLAGLSAATGTVIRVIASMGTLATNANAAAASLARIAAGNVFNPAGAAGATVGSKLGKVAGGALTAASFISRAYVPAMIAYGAYEILDTIERPGEKNPDADKNYTNYLWNRDLNKAERRSKTQSNFTDAWSMPVPPSSERRVSSLKALGLTDDQVADDANPALSAGRINVKSGGFADVNVSGTVHGEAEIHQNITITVEPSEYLKSIVRQATAASSINLNGQLGTGLQGPGDNSVKPSNAAPLGAQ